MARVFARTYREVEWRAVYSSSLRRSITTAQPLCDAVRINVQVRAELNEIAYGKWEGLTKEMVRVLGPHNCIQRIFVAAYSEAGHRLRFRLIR